MVHTMRLQDSGLKDSPLRAECASVGHLCSLSLSTVPALDSRKVKCMNLDTGEDIDKLKEVMAIMSSEIPKLLESISKTMYSADNAAKLGEQTAEFYKKLREAGMTDEQAFKLTEEFMANFSVGSMIGKIIGGARSDEGSDIDREVNERIKKKIKKAMGDEDED